MLSNLFSSFGQYCSAYFSTSNLSKENDAGIRQTLLHTLSRHIEQNDTTAIRLLLTNVEDHPLIAATLVEPKKALLHRIVAEGKVDVLKALIDTLPLTALKARIPNTEQTLFMTAAKNGDEEMLFTLCVALTRKIDAEYPHAGDPDDNFVFHHDPGWVEYQTILNAQDQNGNTALMLAIQAENVPCVTLLDVHRADFLIENQNGQSVRDLVEHLPTDSPLANRVHVRHTVQLGQSTPRRKH